MARPLRIEYPGAVYHVTARGNARAPTYLDDDDRRRFHALFAEVIERQGWKCYAYCLMDNHYHLLIETASANLGCGMRHLNGIYEQRFNRARTAAGAMYFRGVTRRFWWRNRPTCLSCAATWCSTRCARGWWRGQAIGCGAVTGEQSARGWRGVIVPMSTAWLLRQFDDDEGAAWRAYRRFVRAGASARPWDDLRAGLVLGGDGFLATVRDHLATAPNEAPNPQHHLIRKPLAELANTGGERGAWMTDAHDRHGYTLTEIASAAELHYSSVSKIIKVWRSLEL